MIRHENIHKLVRIDNIRSAGDHGMNHICKLVIESETLVLFAWWTQKEFRQMNTTCNYLEGEIWIADDIRFHESSISMAVIISRMYVASLGLGEISIIWRLLCSRCVPSGCSILWTRFCRQAICSSLSLIFLFLVPHVWCVEALYCCNHPSLGIVLSLLGSSHSSSSLFFSSKTPLSSSPLLNWSHCLRSKYSPIPHCFLGGSLYRILGVQFVVVSPLFQWTT